MLSARRICRKIVRDESRVDVLAPERAGNVFGELTELVMLLCSDMMLRKACSVYSIWWS